MYSIRVVETCSDREVELCRVASNPKPIAEAARNVMASKKRRIKRYTAVRIVNLDGTPQDTPLWPHSI